MNLIDLTNCFIDNETEVKRESLKAFISICDNYDIKKLSDALRVPMNVVREWIYEFKKIDNLPINEKVIAFKKINPEFSQRDIANHFKISVGSVNKYLKALR